MPHEYKETWNHTELTSTVWGPVQWNTCKKIKLKSVYKEVNSTKGKNTVVIPTGIKSKLINIIKNILETEDDPPPRNPSLNLRTQ